MYCLRIQNVAHRSVIIFLFARVSLQENERTPLQLNIRYAFSPEVADLNIFRVRSQYELFRYSGIDIHVKSRDTSGIHFVNN